MNETLNQYKYDYRNITFDLTIPDYWSRLYKGKPHNKLYHDYCVMLDLVREINQEKIVLDVGANNGLFSIPASMLGYKVLAFEPVKENYFCLNESKINNHLPDLELFHMALSNVNGEQDIYVPECLDNASFSSAAAVANMKHKNYTVEKVKTVRFDDWIKEHPEYSNIGFIKIDAQGSEYEIVDGMKEFLSEASDIMVFCEYENHLEKMGHTFEQLDELFESCGFVEGNRPTNGDKIWVK